MYCFHWCLTGFYENFLLWNDVAEYVLECHTKALFIDGTIFGHLDKEKCLHTSSRLEREKLQKLWYQELLMLPRCGSFIDLLTPWEI